MKKLSEVTEEDLKDSEEQPSPEEGTEDSVGTDADAAAGAVSGTSRIRVASKLLHIPCKFLVPNWCKQLCVAWYGPCN